MAASFSLSVEQWVEKALDLGDAAFRATALDTINRVKQLTPVRTGFLRANWTAAKNTDEIPLPGRVQDPQAVLRDLKLGEQLLIVNPVVYAARVNFGFTGTDSLGRHYDQRGAHFMEQTMAELPKIAERAVERVMSGGDPLRSPIDPGDSTP